MAAFLIVTFGIAILFAACHGCEGQLHYAEDMTLHGSNATSPGDHGDNKRHETVTSRHIRSREQLLNDELENVAYIRTTQYEISSEYVVTLNAVVIFVQIYDSDCDADVIDENIDTLKLEINRLLETVDWKCKPP